MTHDALLKLWSNILISLALLSGLFSILDPLSLVFDNLPLTLAKGTETWQINMHDLPAMDAAIVIAAFVLPQFMWILAVWQVALLARYYRAGSIFGEHITPRYTRIGIFLVIMGILESLILPVIGLWFYTRKLCPWLPDMPIETIIQPDLVMAGAFFFILGKIMHHGNELQKTDQLTI